MSKIYSLIQKIVRIIVETFFRRARVSGLENIPKDRGGLIISWHPNGMIDPALIFSSFPKRIVFGARHGLFAWPLLGKVIKELGTVPIYRGQDVKKWSLEEQRAKNAESLELMATAISAGSFSALFPEGISHDSPFVHSLKTGAARIYYQARAQGKDDKPPVIIPVGLHYDRKQRFRSNVLVHFHPPMEIPEALDRLPSPEEEKSFQKGLTHEMEKVLTEVIFATESWEVHQIIHCAVSLIASERRKRAGNTKGHIPIQERVLGFSRIWHAYQTQKILAPEKCKRLLEDVEEYRKDLDAVGITSSELDTSPRIFSKRVIVLGLIQLILYTFLLPPFVLVGYLINFPTTLIIKYLSIRYSTEYKDQASVKLFTSIIGYPLTWFIWATGAYFGWVHSELVFPSMPNSAMGAFFFVFFLGVLGAVLMFTYVRAGQRMLRALRIYWKNSQRYDLWVHLREERATLCDELLKMSEGMNLPGSVSKDGRLQK